MRLLLVQHGEAVSDAVDPRKPLSPAGERDVRALAAACRLHKLRARDIIHSGILRAAADQRRSSVRPSPFQSAQLRDWTRWTP